MTRLTAPRGPSHRSLFGGGTLQRRPSFQLRLAAAARRSRAGSLAMRPQNHHANTAARAQADERIKGTGASWWNQAWEDSGSSTCCQKSQRGTGSSGRGGGGDGFPTGCVAVQGGGSGAVGPEAGAGGAGRGGAGSGQGHGRPGGSPPPSAAPRPQAQQRVHGCAPRLQPPPPPTYAAPPWYPWCPRYLRWNDDELLISDNFLTMYASMTWEDADLMSFSPCSRTHVSHGKMMTCCASDHMCICHTGRTARCMYIGRDTSLSAAPLAVGALLLRRRRQRGGGGGGSRPGPPRGRCGGGRDWRDGDLLLHGAGGAKLADRERDKLGSGF